MCIDVYKRVFSTWSVDVDGSFSCLPFSPPGWPEGVPTQSVALTRGAHSPPSLSPPSSLSPRLLKSPSKPLHPLPTCPCAPPPSWAPPNPTETSPNACPTAQQSCAKPTVRWPITGRQAICCGASVLSPIGPGHMTKKCPPNGFSFRADAFLRKFGKVSMCEG